MNDFSSAARLPYTANIKLYQRVYAIVSGMAAKASGQERIDLESALAHILSASVASEDNDLVGVKANLSQAFALVAPSCFKVAA